MSDPNRAKMKQDKQQMKEDKHNAIVAELPEFQPWPKIARLNREIMITEKLDGTNAAVGVTPDGRVYAQSRNRVITTCIDNYGFAYWVEQNADILRELGPGLHFGEWWGVGIERNYGLSERRFSLFNVTRWGRTQEGIATLARIRELGLRNVDTVPVLYEGTWQYKVGYLEAFAPEHILELLRMGGSVAVPGWKDPEGIVVYHKAANMCFKATCERDAEWKGKSEAT